MSLSQYAAEFQRVIGLPLPERRPNRVADAEVRRDGLFAELAGGAFDHPGRLQELQRWATGWAERLDDCQAWEVLGYLSYLAEDWREAARAFMRSIEKDPDNLDAWTDLAFALRHLGVSLADAILFDHEEFVRLWQQDPPARCDLFTLRALEQRIRSEGRDYGSVWQERLEPYRDSILR